METTQISFKWWKERENVDYQCNGTLFGHKKEGSTDTHYSMNEPCENYVSEESHMQKST